MEGASNLTPTTLMRLQLGAILEPRGQVQFAAGSWLHTFRIPLPETLEKPKDIGCPAVHFRRLYTAYAVMAECGTCEQRTPNPRSRNRPLARLVCPQFTFTQEAFNILNETLQEEAEELLDTIYFQLADAITLGIPRSTDEPVAPPAAGARRKRWVGILATGVSTIINLATRVWSHHQTKDKIRRLEDNVKHTAEALNRVASGTAVKMGRFQSAMDLAATGLASLGLRTGHVERHVVKLDQAVRELAIKQASFQDDIKRKKIFDLKVTLLRDMQIASTIQTTQMMQQYIGSLRSYLSAVRRLIRGELPPELVKARHVRRAIESVQEAMLTHLPGYRVALRNLHDIYNLPVRSVAVYNQSLYVTTAIPIGPKQQTFTAYRLSTFPKMAGPSEERRYTEFVNVPEILAVSSDYFVEMSLPEFQACRGDRTGRLCQQLQPEHDLTQDTCAMAIFRDDRQLAIKMCQADYVLSAQPRDIIVPLSEGQLYIVMLVDIHSWAISCVGERTVVRDQCVNCLVDLPCLCSLRTSKSYIPAPVQECEDYASMSTVIPVRYVANVMYLARFMSLEKLSLLINNDTLRDEALARGPGMETSYMDKDWAPLQSNGDRRIGLDQINITMIEPVDSIDWEDLDPNDPQVHRKNNTRRGKTNFTLVIIAFTVIGALCILTALIYRHYGTLMRMARFLAVAGGLPVGTSLPQATTLPPPIHLKMAATTTLSAGPPESAFGDLTSCGDWVQLSLLLLAFIGALNVIWQTAHLLRSCSKPGWKESLRLFCRRGMGIYRAEDARLLVEVTSAQECVRMWVDNWAGPPGRYRLHPYADLTRARPTFHISHGCAWMRLSIGWSGIRLYDDHERQPRSLPSKVRVPWLDRHAVKRVLMTKMSIRLLIGNRDVYTPISLTQVAMSREDAESYSEYPEPTTPKLAYPGNRTESHEWDPFINSNPRSRSSTINYDSSPDRSKTRRTKIPPAPPARQRSTLSSRSAENLLRDPPNYPPPPEVRDSPYETRYQHEREPPTPTFGRATTCEPSRSARATHASISSLV